MMLFAIILALIIEQIHALPVCRVVIRPAAALCALLERHFNDGRHLHGVVAWGLGVALPAFVLLLAHAWLDEVSPALAFLLALGVLYLTMGFRQFSHYFGEIQAALRADDLEAARHGLAQWRGGNTERATRSDIARLAIEEALLASHRHVFAPLFWFAVFGPAGAVIYRLAERFDANWGRRGDPDFGEFGHFSRRAFSAIDWLPVRMTAAAFAIVGDFEDAVYCWRNQAEGWTESASGILLASGAGALGVRLGMPVAEPVPGDLPDADRPELGLGDEADPDFMQSTIGLVWRTLVLVLLLLALVWISGWMGG